MAHIQEDPSGQSRLSCVLMGKILSKSGFTSVSSRAEAASLHHNQGDHTLFPGHYTSKHVISSMVLGRNKRRAYVPLRYFDH